MKNKYVCFYKLRNLCLVVAMMGATLASNMSAVVVGLVLGEMGSGEDGSEDCVMDTSDSGTGGSDSGITHTRGTGNSGYSGGESGARGAPAAAVDHFTPKMDLNPVIALVAASTAPNVSSVAFAVSAGANDNGCGWGDFEKPLDMLPAEEIKMWKEKKTIACMKERRRTSNLKCK